MPVAHINGKPRALHSWRRGPARAAPAITADVALPVAVDLTPIMPPVMDQGELGSCVAHGCLECLEYTERAGANDTLYSRLDLYYWARKREGVDPTVDSGLIIADAVATLQDHGVCLESAWPYDVTTFATMPPVDAPRQKLLLAYACPNLFTIKASLSQSFPVVFGMDVYSSLMTTATGDVEMPAQGEAVQGGHCVVCVGFDDASQRLIFRNSWGTGWGRNGNGTIPYAFVDQGIASDFYTFRRATL